MEILSLSFGVEVRQALSYADVTLRVWNKTLMLGDEKGKYTTAASKKHTYQNERGRSSETILPPRNMTDDFCANRARLLILSRGAEQPGRTGWRDLPHSAAPRWRWEGEMYGYNGQIRWGVSSAAPLRGCKAHD